MLPQQHWREERMISQAWFGQLNFKWWSLNVLEESGFCCWKFLRAAFTKSTYYFDRFLLLSTSLINNLFTQRYNSVDHFFFHSVMADYSIFPGNPGWKRDVLSNFPERGKKQTIRERSRPWLLLFLHNKWSFQRPPPSNTVVLIDIDTFMSPYLPAFWFGIFISTPVLVGKEPHRSFLPAYHIHLKHYTKHVTDSIRAGGLQRGRPVCY